MLACDCTRVTVLFLFFYRPFLNIHPSTTVPKALTWLLARETAAELVGQRVRRSRRVRHWVSGVMRS